MANDSADLMKQFRRDQIFERANLPLSVMKVIYNPRPARSRKITPAIEEGVHYHDFMEIVVVTGGSCLHKTVDGERTIRKGDAFVLRPGAWHGYFNCRALAIYNCCFGAEVLQHELGWLMSDPMLVNLFWRGPLADDRKGKLHLTLDTPMLARCQNALENLLTAIKTPGRLNRADIMGHLLVLIGGLAETWSRQANLPTEYKPWPQVVIQAVCMLEADPAHPWTMAELSRSLHLDESYLSRLFKQATGFPPLAYLARHRAERATSLLLRSSLSIAEVGAAVGWSEPIHFARRFKFFFGMTASDYRKQFCSLALSSKS